MTQTDHQAASAAGRRRNNRRGQGERLRAELLDAAAALLSEAGPAALSLRAVAARVGVAATSVYLHFHDIDALKLALAHRCFADFAAARDEAGAGLTDPAEALVARSRAYARYALEHPGEYRLMFGPDLVATPAGSPGAPGSAALDALAESIRRCQESGRAPATIPPARLAVLVWTGLHGQVVLRTDRPAFPWPPVDDLVADLVTRLVGLKGDPVRD